MKDMEQILDQNYERIVDPSCIPYVVQHLRDTPNVHGLDLVYIKKLTKVATNILEYDAEALEGLCEKVFDFHLEGVKEASSKSVTNLSRRNTNLIIGHLYSHAAQVAGIIYERTGDADWLIEIVNNGENANDPLLGVEAHNTAIRLSKSGDAAGKLADLASDVDDRVYWAYKALDLTLEACSKEISEEQPLIGITAAGSRANAAARIFDITKKYSDGKVYVDATTQMADLLSTNKPLESAKVYTHTARNTAYIVKVSNASTKQNEKMLKKGVSLCKKALRLFPANNPALIDDTTSLLHTIKRKLKKGKKKQYLKGKRVSSMKRDTIPLR
jgi:hypothetical protein